MAESMTTPTKISARNPLCRLCGGSHKCLYMLQIFSKTGLSKDLCSKVYKTCGIRPYKNFWGRYEVSSVMYEWRFIRRQSGSVYSESSICRQHAVWFELRIFCKAMRSTFTVFTSAVEASIKRYATRKLRCSGWAAIKEGGRPTFTSCQSAARSNTFSFSLCWVHYAREGSKFSLSRCDFSRLCHTKRSWHTYRCTVVFVSGRQDLPSDARAFSLTAFKV